MYEPIFTDSWAKLERAKEHAGALEDTFRMLAPEANRPRVGIKFELATGEHVLYINRLSDDVGPIIQKCSTIIGDVVHNLRSALDHLTFQLAVRNATGNLQDKRRVQFPIEDREATFERRCISKDRGGWIADLHPDDRTVIKGYQPFQRRREGEWLALLRDLSDADKHRLLVSLAIPGNYIDSAHSVVGSIIDAAMKRRGSQAVPAQIPTIELGTELYRAIVPGLPVGEVEMAGYIVPTIVLAESGTPPLLALFAVNRLIEIIERLLRHFGSPA